jgi:predicted P-loop ATPase
MIKVDKDQYWAKVVDYYYDNIHWSMSNIKPETTLRDWLNTEYSAHECIDSHTLIFLDPKKYTYFVLLWS